MTRGRRSRLTTIEEFVRQHPELEVLRLPTQTRAGYIPAQRTVAFADSLDGPAEHQAVELIQRLIEAEEPDA